MMSGSSSKVKYEILLRLVQMYLVLLGEIGHISTVILVFISKKSQFFLLYHGGEHLCSLHIC